MPSLCSIVDKVLSWPRFTTALERWRDTVHRGISVRPLGWRRVDIGASRPILTSSAERRVLPPPPAVLTPAIAFSCRDQHGDQLILSAAQGPIFMATTDPIGKRHILERMATLDVCGGGAPRTPMATASARGRLLRFLGGHGRRVLRLGNVLYQACQNDHAGICATTASPASPMRSPATTTPAPPSIRATSPPSRQPRRHLRQWRLLVSELVLDATT